MIIPFRKNTHHLVTIPRISTEEVSIKQGALSDVLSVILSNNLSWNAHQQAMKFPSHTPLEF